MVSIFTTEPAGPTTEHYNTKKNTVQYAIFKLRTTLQPTFYWHLIPKILGRNLCEIFFNNPQLSW
jgi:hypothetical protein